MPIAISAYRIDGHFVTANIFMSSDEARDLCWRELFQYPLWNNVLTAVRFVVAKQAGIFRHELWSSQEV